MVSDDPEIGFVAAKNASSLRRRVVELPGGGTSYADTYRVSTDGRGARVNQKGEQTPPRVDFLTIGCSSWGHGIENDRTCTKQMKKKMGVSGANVAFASYSGLAALQMLKRSLDLKPKVIVYGFMHLVRNLAPCAPSYSPFCLAQSYVSFDERDRPYVHPPHTGYGSAVLNRDYYRDVLAAEPPLSIRDVFWEMRRDFFRLTHRRELVTVSDAAHQTLAMDFVLRGMTEAAKSVNAQLVVVYIPIGAPPEALMGPLKGKELTFVDLQPCFRRWFADPGHAALPLSLSDGHPNATAHELIADELLGVVTPLLNHAAPKS
jgi:hypothetical protein